MRMLVEICYIILFFYKRTSRYGYLSITDSFQCPDKMLLNFL